MRRARWWPWLMGLVGAITLVIWLQRPQPAAEPQSGVLTLAAPTDGESFERAMMPLEIELPRDFGPHFGFQTEWWYYTGNLEAEGGRRFAYQLTFFRRGLSPGPTDRSASLATDQIYFAHFALTDVEAGEHQAWERFSRGAGGLAGAQVAPLRVWLEDWQVSGEDQDGESIRLQAAADGVVIDLELSAVKPLVLHGREGLSPKSEQAGNASYYFSQTRQDTQGTIEVDGAQFEVRGSSWHDHEWSTSALGPEAVGWDWFSLQLDDGSELMLFQIRRRDGSIESVSAGTFVGVDGTVQVLTNSDFSIFPLGSWTSPETGVEYPSGWQIEVPELDLALDLSPLIPDQEMNVSFVYWEGAVTIEGEVGGRSVSGYGFVELTGYGDSMQGVF